MKKIIATTLVALTLITNFSFAEQVNMKVPDKNGKMVEVSGELVNVTDEMLPMINKIRQETGAVTLEKGVEKEIEEFAKKRAVEISKYPAHENAITKQAEFKKYTKIYHHTAENMAAGAKSIQRYFDLFNQSDGHRKNMIRPTYRKAYIYHFTPNSKEEYSSYIIQIFLGDKDEK